MVEVGGARDITGSWHAFHLVEVIPDEQSTTADYRLTSSIQLFLTVENEGIGKATQNGTLTRQVCIEWLIEEVDFIQASLSIGQRSHCQYWSDD